MTVALPSHLSPALIHLVLFFFFLCYGPLWAIMLNFKKDTDGENFWIYFSNIFSPRKWSWTVLTPLEVADELMGQLLEKHAPKAVFHALATSARLHFSRCFPGNGATSSDHFLLMKRKWEIRIVRFYKHLNAWEMQSNELFYRAAGERRKEITS